MAEANTIQSLVAMIRLAKYSMIQKEATNSPSKKTLSFLTGSTGPQKPQSNICDPIFIANFHIFRFL